MAKPTNVPVKPFVNEEMEFVKDQFHAAGLKIPSNEVLVGGLILAARAFPAEALIPFVREYWRRERADMGREDPPDASG